MCDLEQKRILYKEGCYYIRMRPLTTDGQQHQAKFIKQ